MEDCRITITLLFLLIVHFDVALSKHVNSRLKISNQFLPTRNGLSTSSPFYDAQLPTYNQGEIILTELLAEAKNYQSSKVTGVCQSLVNEACNPCYNLKKDHPPCKDWKAECVKLMCNPLCLRLTWDVSVTVSGGSTEFQEQAKNIATQLALGSQFRAHACAKILGCCEENESLLDWVETRTYGGYFPTSLLPMPSCLDGDRQQKCSQCKSAVSITLKSKEGICDKFIDVKPPSGAAAAAFQRAKVMDVSNQVPKDLNFQKRCKKMQEKLQSNFGSMQSAFQQKVCSCMGCCDSSSPDETCFYPVAYNSVDAALKSKS